MAIHPDNARLYPHSVEAERAVLGYVLLDNTVLNTAIELISRDDFYLEGHRITFDKMLALSERSEVIDIVTLSDALGREDLLEKAGGAGYLSQLTDGVPIGTSSGFREYCGIVKEKSTVRRLVNAGNNIIAKCMEGTDNSAALLDMAQAQIFDLSAGRLTTGFESFHKIATENFADLSSVMARGRAHTGIDTGLVDFDSLTCGLQPQDLIIVAAMTSAGKTALALCILVHAAVHNAKKVGLFSLEMSKSAIITRLLCCEGRIDSHKMRTGFCGREDTNRAMAAMGRLAAAPIFIDDLAGQTIPQIRAKARRLKAEHGLDLIIVDYLQLVAPGRKCENRTQEVSYVSRSLKSIAKELNVPLIALSQLSRAPDKRKTSRPMLSDLRESGTIEQDADVVAFIYADPRDRDEAIEDQGGRKITLILAKQRNGPTGDIPLAFIKPYARFENYAVDPDPHEESESAERLPYSDD